MRNLKRALSLGLTAAMISGLMVMGTSAASYADVTSENNVEAIDVLQTVGIMVGDENGNFNPDQNVTRNEMAVIMSNLMEYNVATYKDTSPFTDVPSWAEPYVAACWTNGITSGYSDTIYGGSDTVTTAQAALMLMKALGYFQYASDFGSDWQLATTRQANAIDLFVGVDSGVTAPMTRNDVAQLVLNTLEAGTVEASTDGSWTIGDVTINNNVTYNYITSNADYAYAISEDKSTNTTTDATQSIVELGEQLYMGDLELDDDDLDVFGRPSRTWTYDSDKIGTYMKTELLRQEYTTEVTGRDLYDLLGNNVIDTYTFRIAVDGETERAVLGDAYFTENNFVRANDDAVGETGNGVLTQVFVDNIDKEVNIAVINTYLAIAGEDYDERNDEVDLDVYAIDEVRDNQFVKTLTDDEDVYTFTVSGDDFAIEDVAEDDRYLVTVADGEIQTIQAPEVLAASTVSSFRIDKYVVTEGTQYDFADTAEYDVETLEEWTGIANASNLKDLTYDIILDPYGYAIGVKLNENPNQYVFVTGIDVNNSNLATRNADANVIFLDGTMDTVTVNLRNSRGLNAAGQTVSDNGTLLNGINENLYAQLNTWCTYTVDSNGVYTLRRVATTTRDADNDVYGVMQNVQDVTGNDAVEINESHVSLLGAGAANREFYRVYGDDETVYINVDNRDDLENIEDNNENEVRIIDDIDSVVVGVKNVDIEVTNVEDDGNFVAPENEIYTLHDDDGDIIAVLTIGEDMGTTSNYAYITGDVNYEGYDSSADVWSWTVPAIVNGEVVELREEGDGLDLLEGLLEGRWYEVRYNADGNVRSIDILDENGENDGDAADDDEYLTDIDVLQATIDADQDPIVARFDYTAGNGTNLSYDHGTLFVNTTGEPSRGFAVASDAKVVLCLASKEGAMPNTGNAFDEVIDTYTLERALRNLDDENGNLVGYLSVIFENGVATTIILDDRTGRQNVDYNPVEDMLITVNLMNSTGTTVLGTDEIVYTSAMADPYVVNPADYADDIHTVYGWAGTWTAVNSLPVAVDFVEGGERTLTFYYREADPVVVENTIKVEAPADTYVTINGVSKGNGGVFSGYEVGDGVSYTVSYEGTAVVDPEITVNGKVQSSGRVMIEAGENVLTVEVAEATYALTTDLTTNTQSGVANGDWNLDLSAFDKEYKAGDPVTINLTFDGVGSTTEIKSATVNGISATVSNWVNGTPADDAQWNGAPSGFANKGAFDYALEESIDGKLYTVWEDTTSGYITSWDDMVPGTAYYWIKEAATNGTEATFSITFEMPKADTDVTSIELGI